MSVWDRACWHASRARQRGRASRATGAECGCEWVSWGGRGTASVEG